LHDNHPMQHLFGPVRSRRLGRSLGIDLLSEKICPFDCLYCEAGPTVVRTCQRREYVPVADIIAEVEQWLNREGQTGIDVCTVTAQGEPTLHSGLGEVLRFLRRRGGVPVVLLTNGALLQDSALRREVAEADIVVPSLDAARESSFRRVNRPGPEVELAGIIEGLEALFAEHPGRVWLEILLVAGCNDAEEDIAALARVLRRLPGTDRHRVQLNTVSRPSRTADVAPLAPGRLQEIAVQLQTGCGVPVEVLTSGPAAAPLSSADSAEAALGRTLLSAGRSLADNMVQMVRRRPCTAEELCAAQGFSARDGVGHEVLTRLVAEGRLRRLRRGEVEYYLPVS